jgi:hypothetical protein
LYLFRPFRNVERLFLTKNVARFVKQALEDESEPVMRPLPNAKVIGPESESPRLHPQLVAPSLQWDVRCHYSQITSQLSPTVLTEPASHPPLPSMIIRVGGLPWRAIVLPDPRLKKTIVTVKDVLAAIYANLRTPVDPTEYDPRSKDAWVYAMYTQAAITQAVQRRVGSNLVQPLGLLRIDHLRGRFYVQGLASREDDVWDVLVY